MVILRSCDITRLTRKLMCCIYRFQPSYGLTGLALVRALVRAGSRTGWLSYGLALVRADGAQPSLYIDDEHVHIRTVYIYMALWPLR
jgi:hypothetical protein